MQKKYFMILLVRQLKKCYFLAGTLRLPNRLLDVSEDVASYCVTGIFRDIKCSLSPRQRQHNILHKNIYIVKIIKFECSNVQALSSTNTLQQGCKAKLLALQIKAVYSIQLLLKATVTLSILRLMSFLFLAFRWQGLTQMAVL